MPKRPFAFCLVSRAFWGALLLSVGWLACPAARAQAKAATFTTPDANRAQARYDQAVSVATQQYVRELDAAVKAAMQSGNLDEANLIAATAKAVTAGESLDGDFKTAPARAAKARYVQALTAAKLLYSRELERALRPVLASANLEEANAINATRTKLDEEVKGLGGSRTSTPVGFSEPPTNPGLLVKEYPRVPSQDDKMKAVIPIDTLGEAQKKTYTIRSLAEWKHDPNHNAVATGFLKVEKEGDYGFMTKGFYGRVKLVVDGQEVKGDEKIATVKLKAGLVPIISVGYVESRGYVIVKWRPPGQKDLGEIPGKLLYH